MVNRQFYQEVLARLRDAVHRKRPELWENQTWIQENAIRELRAFTESAFQEAFQQWKKRWERCIASRGDYFEGDSA